MPEKTIAIRVDEELFKKVKVRHAENGMTLKDYVISLIEKDLQENAKLKGKAVPSDSDIDEASVKEAQKVLDFVNEIISNQYRNQ